MVDFIIREIINQPRDIVIKAFLNPANMIFWTKDLEKFEVIAGKPGEIGSIAYLHYRQNNKRYKMRDELIECNPGFRYLSRVTGDTITATVETYLKDVGNDTELTIHWTGSGNSFLLKIILPLSKRKMIHQAKNKLKTFKDLVEKRGVHFNIFVHKISKYTL
ncbi:MAG TPA: SRPBCC family protein [Halanaerobiales bacterium]|nr:SRPBCC family protein [Halanaerobiales bacterium]